MQDNDVVEANSESGSTFGVLTPDGTIQYQMYEGVDVGICMEQAPDAINYKTVIGVFIVIFAIVLIAVSTYCLCNQCLG
jgi:hypothetical protein